MIRWIILSAQYRRYSKKPAGPLLAYHDLVFKKTISKDPESKPLLKSLINAIVLPEDRITDIKKFRISNPTMFPANYNIKEMILDIKAVQEGEEFPSSWRFDVINNPDWRPPTGRGNEKDRPKIMSENSNKDFKAARESSGLQPISTQPQVAVKSLLPVCCMMARRNMKHKLTDIEVQEQFRLHKNKILVLVEFIKLWKRALETFFQ